VIRHYYARSPRPQQAALLLLIIGFLALDQWALAAPQFPNLTGRVVDNAELLSTSEHERLTRLLAEHESQTTNQVVVVTLESLQGYEIEDFGYQLGRHWGIGQEGKDNGVLLVVAPNERKVRIEVGYGLEGTLTDALSRNIIEVHILSAFKAGNYETGIRRGTEGILAALGGTYRSKWVQRETYRSTQRNPKTARSLPVKWQDIWWQILLGIVFGIFLLFSGVTKDGGGGSSRSSGGFSGGGGSFGGGGASGSW
jgi:uncharacterized protein